MSSARRSENARRCRRRCARAQAPAWRSTRRPAANLELMRTLAGDRRGSLLDAIDRTVTAAGSRMLAQRLAAPLTDPAADCQTARRSRDICQARQRHALKPARACRRRPIWPARCRDWRSAAAGRAISPPSATACWRPPNCARALDLARATPRQKSAEAHASLPRQPDGMLAAELAAALGGRTARLQARWRFRARRLQLNAR